MSIGSVELMVCGGVFMLLILLGMLYVLWQRRGTGGE